MCARAGQAYRFLTLVDVLYDHRVRLVCSAEVDPLDLFAHILTQEQYREVAQRGQVCRQPVFHIHLIPCALQAPRPVFTDSSHVLTQAQHRRLAERGQVCRHSLSQ